MRRVVSFLCLALGLSLSLQAAIPTSERQALIALFNSTNGPGWVDNSGWNGSAGSECSWVGVQCDENERYRS